MASRCCVPPLPTWRRQVSPASWTPQAPWSGQATEYPRQTPGRSNCGCSGADETGTRQGIDGVPSIERSFYSACFKSILTRNACFKRPAICSNRRPAKPPACCRQHNGHNPAFPGKIRLRRGLSVGWPMPRSRAASGQRDAGALDVGRGAAPAHPAAGGRRRSGHRRVAASPPAKGWRPSWASAKKRSPATGQPPASPASAC